MRYPWELAERKQVELETKLKAATEWAKREVRSRDSAQTTCARLALENVKMGVLVAKLQRRLHSNRTKVKRMHREIKLLRLQLHVSQNLLGDEVVPLPPAEEEQLYLPFDPFDAKVADYER